VDEVTKKGGRIDFIATCPHLPIDNCICRKPEPGLVYAILDKFRVPKNQSLLLGNAETDVQAGQSAGIASFISTGIGIKKQISEWINQIDNH
jgi:D-glycero-D-manno-heptose 1,7-bisphosphate phosphatase